MRYVELEDGYVLYEDGTVYSPYTGSPLTVTLNASGYLTYSSRLGAVHRLLAHHFIAPIPPGMVVNHKDGNKMNNCLDNLEIVTHKENVKHAYTHGLANGAKGGDNSMAKLTEEQILEIYNLFKLGYTNRQIADIYHIHERYVSLVRHGKRWEYLYIQHGPFDKSYTPSIYDEKYQRFLELKDTTRNKEIAIELGIDASTISRWRSGETRNNQRK